MVTRRRGTTALRNVVLGGVAAKLVAKIVFIPLILVGKKPTGNKILVGFDGSRDALKAVDLVGSVLAGFKSRSISTKIIIGKSSRAKAIADEARQYGFGAIVMGRKGRSRVREFFIGRVTNKVIHIARDRSVWVIR